MKEKTKRKKGKKKQSHISEKIKKERKVVKEIKRRKF
jgi:hypothetical protein